MTTDVGRAKLRPSHGAGLLPRGLTSSGHPEWGG